MLQFCKHSITGLDFSIGVCLARFCAFSSCLNFFENSGLLSFVTVELTWELAREGAVWDVLHTFTCFHWNGLDFPFSSNIYWSHTSQTLFWNFWLCCINCRCQPGSFFPLTIQCSAQYNQEKKIKCFNSMRFSFYHPQTEKNAKRDKSVSAPDVCKNLFFTQLKKCTKCFWNASCSCSLTYQGHIWRVCL